MQTALLRQLEPSCVHLNAPVVAIELLPSKRALLRFERVEKDQTEKEGYDHLVLALPADRAAALLQPFVQAKRMVESLEQVRYTSVTVVNHTDRRLLPATRQDWRDLNLVCPSLPTQNEKESNKAEQTMATHLLWDGFESATGSQTLLQTTAPMLPWIPRPATVLSTATLQRALSSVEMVQARRSLFQRDRTGLQVGPEQGVRLEEEDDAQNGVRVWVCGAFAQGLPLLEGCVASAQAVARAIAA